MSACIVCVKYSAVRFRVVGVMLYFLLAFGRFCLCVLSVISRVPPPRCTSVRSSESSVVSKGQGLGIQACQLVHILVFLA